MQDRTARIPRQGEAQYTMSLFKLAACTPMHANVQKGDPSPLQVAAREGGMTGHSGRRLAQKLVKVSRRVSILAFDYRRCNVRLPEET